MQMDSNSLHDAVVVRGDVRRGAELQGALLRYLTRPEQRRRGRNVNGWKMTFLFCRIRVIQVMRMSSKM